MRILVVASEPVSREILEASIGERPEDAEVMVVAPAMSDSGLRFWVSDVDKAIAAADRVQEESVAHLQAAGIDASGDTGEAEPLDAIADILETFDADRIVVVRHPDDQLAYREDQLTGDIEARFGRPVSEHLVSR